MTIPTDKHCFIAGATGSGKSFLVEHYTANYDYVVKLDTKDEVTERRRTGSGLWADLEENKDFTVVRDFEQLDDCGTDKIIYAPDYDEQNEDNFNRFFRWVFERENTLLWIDELMSVCTAQRCPRELARISQQGRSKNVALWTCSQRPSSIPIILLANSTYFFVFNLNWYDDRKRMAQITGCAEMLELPKNHNFWYYKMGDERCILAVLTT